MMNREAKIKVLNGKICPYCGDEPNLVPSENIYGKGHDYGNLWACSNCDAYVGCHSGGNKPLGRLANRRLRDWKKKAHAAFDPLWRYGAMSRGQAYVWLAEQLSINPEYCHIGMMSIRYCKKTTRLSKIKQSQN